MKFELDEKFKKRFWEKVDSSGGPDSCWPWNGCRDENGYGRIIVGGRKNRTRLRTHRVSFEISNGPLGDLQCLHRCDNPCCVNPKHLFSGTIQDNNIDRIMKGRSKGACGDANGSRTHPERLPHGERNKKAKLTESEVLEIRASYVRGVVTRQRLAEKYNVSVGQIGLIVVGKSWRYLMIGDKP